MILSLIVQQNYIFINSILFKYAKISNQNPIVESWSVITRNQQQWNLGKSSRPIWKKPSLSGGTSSSVINHWRNSWITTFLQPLPPPPPPPSTSLFTFSNNPLPHNSCRLGLSGFSMKSLKSSMISMWTKRKSLLSASRFFPHFLFSFHFLLCTFIFFFLLVSVKIVYL